GEPCDDRVVREVERTIQVDEYTSTTLDGGGQRAERRDDRRVKNVRRRERCERDGGRHVGRSPPSKQNGRYRGEPLSGEPGRLEGRHGTSPPPSSASPSADPSVRDERGSGWSSGMGGVGFKLEHAASAVPASDKPRTREARRRVMRGARAHRLTGTP